ncbi:MAG: Sec-independent protein translocase protein TatB [Alphaproteobacteria bacterium]
MFGIGMPEMVVILVVALIVLGPRRLPEVARALGKGLAEFRKVTGDVNKELDAARAMIEAEARQHESDQRRKAREKAIEEARASAEAAAPAAPAATEAVATGPASPATAPAPAQATEGEDRA